MLIEALMNLVKNLLSSLLFFELPSLPESFTVALDTFVGLFKYGTGIFRFAFPVSLSGFLTVWVAIEVFKRAYPFIMWVLRKIPFLNLK